jgi:hypothetical protein
VTSAYDGYWGAGAGIMTFALLMISTGHQLTRSNALKNMFLGIADVTCCVVFIPVLARRLGSRSPNGHRRPDWQHDRAPLTRRCPDTYFVSSPHSPDSDSPSTYGPEATEPERACSPLAGTAVSASVDCLWHQRAHTLRNPPDARNP